MHKALSLVVLLTSIVFPAGVIAQFDVNGQLSAQFTRSSNVSEASLTPIIQFQYDLNKVSLGSNWQGVLGVSDGNIRPFNWQSNSQLNWMSPSQYLSFVAAYSHQIVNNQISQFDQELDTVSGTGQIRIPVSQLISASMIIGSTNRRIDDAFSNSVEDYSLDSMISTQWTASPYISYSTTVRNVQNDVAPDSIDVSGLVSTDGSRLDLGMSVGWNLVQGDNESETITWSANTNFDLRTFRLLISTQRLQADSISVFELSGLDLTISQQATNIVEIDRVQIADFMLSDRITFSVNWESGTNESILQINELEESIESEYGSLALVIQSDQFSRGFYGLSYNYAWQDSTVTESLNARFSKSLSGDWQFASNVGYQLNADRFPFSVGLSMSYLLGD